MTTMIQRAAAAALLSIAPGLVSGCRHGQGTAAAPSGADPAMARRVAQVFVPEPTATPPIIVVQPSATQTRPVTPTHAPTATRAPSRTPPPSSTPVARAVAQARPVSGAAATATHTRSPSGFASHPKTAAPSRTPVPRTPRPPTLTPAPTEDNSLAAQLHRGGLVVFFRHARTDWGQNDRELAWVPDMLDDRSLLGDCDRQRLLSDAGRDDARAIGASIARQGFPVGEVLTSGWCRTRETAQLIFGRGQPAPDRLFDTGYLAAGSAERNAYGAALRALLSANVDGGTNRFLVGHGPQIYDVAHVSLEESQAVIVRPEGGSFKVLRQIAPSGWDDLGH
jgi:phosphohistidine phosphatase SixA